VETVSEISAVEMMEIAAVATATEAFAEAWNHKTEAFQKPEKICKRNLENADIGMWNR
jgi:hypothetical protein